MLIPVAIRFSRYAFTSLASLTLAAIGGLDMLGQISAALSAATLLSLPLTINMAEDVQRIEADIQVTDTRAVAIHILAARCSSKFSVFLFSIVCVCVVGGIYSSDEFITIFSFALVLGVAQTSWVIEATIARQKERWIFESFLSSYLPALPLLLFSATSAIGFSVKNMYVICVFVLLVSTGFSLALNFLAALKFNLILKPEQLNPRPYQQLALSARRARNDLAIVLINSIDSSSAGLLRLCLQAYTLALVPKTQMNAQLKNYFTTTDILETRKALIHSIILIGVYTVIAVVISILLSSLIFIEPLAGIIVHDRWIPLAAGIWLLALYLEIIDGVNIRALIYFDDNRVGIYTFISILIFWCMFAMLYSVTQNLVIIFFTSLSCSNLSRLLLNQYSLLRYRSQDVAS
jgi:energy-converting hydrogenase Eha subunit F